MSAVTASYLVNNPEHFVEQQATMLRSMAQRMLEGPQRILEQQEALLAVIKDPAFQGDNLSAAFQLLTATAARLMQVSRVGIWRYTPSREGIQCLALYQLGIDQHSGGVVLNADKFPGYFEALAVSEAICADDARTDLRTREFRDSYLDPLNIKSMMDIPLILFGRLEGVICHEQIGSRRDWSPEDRLFGMAIANLAVLVMERFHRTEAARQQKHDEELKRHEIEERLRQSEERYRTLVNNLKVVVFQTDAQGRWNFLNPAWEEISGYPVGESLSRTLECYVHHVDRELCKELCDTVIDAGKDHVAQLRLITRNGEQRWVEVAARPMSGSPGEVIGCSGTLTDITERKASAARIEQLAYHDGLTGLPNRMLLLDRLDRALVDGRRYGRNVAVLFLDLDDFKRINDTHGHAVGDSLLMQLGARLKDLLREGDTVARFGGDEFLLVLRDFQSGDDAVEVARKAIGALARPFIVNGGSFRISASIGISVYPDDASDREALLKHADVALYQAKSKGGNTFFFYAG